MAFRSQTQSSTVNYDIVVKSIIIGDSGVGKSSLLYRYTDQDWNPHYIATIGVDFKVLTFDREGKVVKLQLWDTAGQERFRTITHSYYRGAHGVMLVFDVTSRESFENISSWLQDVGKFASTEIPMLLVGNKSDMVASREVSDEEAKALASAIGCRYMTTSAKNNNSVDEAFDYLADECINRRKKVMSDRKQQPLPMPLPLRKDGKGGDKEPTCKC